ncbi:PREDICTED: centromere protein N [Gekko japonicus]|uniref:Centromere protein N n=1 Tax=Gekko japonicus TaxID=146911 RepID=A0ABM1JIM0_GEKJA|nr:PREDICTED: centromere protein N [Gekko japonicus]XP_015261308.1 PREDICTED: centromere protein N [Gekko japonicus]
MDEIVAEYIRRTVLRIPRSEIGKMLTTWGFLSENQLQSINLHQIKENLSREVVQLCEENGATIKHAANLDIIYNYTYRDKKTWTVYKMTREGGDENIIFNMVDFKNKFKTSLQLLLKNVTITFKKYEDNSVWIRVAWGTQFKKPNQYKPTYVVYHSQTPYVFISHSIYKSCRDMLFQALLAATSYSEIHEMDLRSRCLDSLKDIVFKRCNQNVQNFHPRPLQERNSALGKVDPRIIQEDKNKKETIWRINEEDFGNGSLPKLQYAQYKLETVFKSKPELGILNDKEPFRCLVTFSSPHLLEALKSLAPAGLATAPLSRLLTCIVPDAKNSFKITEKKHGFSHGHPDQ